MYVKILKVEHYSFMINNIGKLFYFTISVFSLRSSHINIYNHSCVLSQVLDYKKKYKYNPSL